MMDNSPIAKMIGSLEIKICNYVSLCVLFFLKKVAVDESTYIALTTPSNPEVCNSTSRSSALSSSRETSLAEIPEYGQRNMSLAYHIEQ
jgi:hypothetical protein